jgi:hypothetical protein
VCQDLSAVVNIKKGQLLAPQAMEYSVKKVLKTRGFDGDVVVDMAIAMIKNIFLHILIILSSLCNTSFATDNNFNSANVYKQYYNKLEDKKQTNEHRNKEKNKKKIDYVPLKINFNKNEVKEVYEKWQKYNTGTYVYVSDSTTLRDSKFLIYVKKNRVVGYTPYLATSLKSNMISTMNLKHNMLTRNNRFFLSAKNTEFYLIDKRFEKALKNFKNIEFYDCRILNLAFDKSKMYISLLGLMSLNPYMCNSRLRPKDVANSWYVHSYGLLMLPKETEYTEDLVQKTLNKYKQAWECEKKLLASKRINNEQKLTLLEKKVGKKKLECLEKYLVWDKNESK